ncbi:hypothetical protein BDZ45DRAFT_746253 [Acephala macrosclerotiorum]|nr:hypothetical protein BDZ45DRAFT_746253 [Acephala macrosclerotiorum]
MLAELSSFHLFPKLPTELRLKILEHTLKPRCLRLKVHQALCNHNTFYSEQEMARSLMFSGEPYILGEGLPIVLQVNKESRREFLPRYPVLFGGIYTIGSHARRFQPQNGVVRFNAAIDILSLVVDTWKEIGKLISLSVFAEDTARIRCIMVNLVFWQVPEMPLPLEKHL